MKTTFDSSVLIAALLETHPFHDAAYESVTRHRANRGEFAVSQHALLETYAVLTGMPIRPRLPPSLVRLAMKELLEPAFVIALTPADYEECMTWAEDSDFIGGTVYDLLHYRAAQIWGANQLITLNAKHFRRFSRGSQVTVVEP